MSAIVDIIQQGADITTKILTSILEFARVGVTKMLPSVAWDLILIGISVGLAFLLANTLEKTRTQDIRVTRQASFIFISAVLIFVILRLLSGGK